MIFDKIENYQIYKFGKTWEMVFDFLNSVDADTAETMYELEDGVVAYVTSYFTKAKDEAGLESHRKAIDLHATIVGQEKIECFYREELSVLEQYDDSEDVEYYVCPGAPPATLNNSTGYFTALWPTDAHMPSLIVDSKSNIKKVVFKIPVESLA